MSELEYTILNSGTSEWRTSYLLNFLDVIYINNLHLIRRKVSFIIIERLSFLSCQRFGSGGE